MFGSRFSKRPGIAVQTGERGEDPSGFDGDTGDARARIVSALGGEPGPLDGLGKPSIGNASYGRGAAGWIAVVEWGSGALASGVVGNAAYDSLKSAARAFARVVRTTRERDARVLVNGTGAALIAAADLVEVVPDSDFYVEATQEFAAVAGHSPTEPNPVGVEPWLVVIVDLTCERRWIYVITVTGEIATKTSVAISELELLYMRVRLADSARMLADVELDTAGAALRLLLEAHVEPDRRVERRHLVQQDVAELGLERVAVLLAGEVAALAAPVGDRAGDPVDHLLDRPLARRRVELATEVLLRDAVRRVQRPRLREVDVLLLERPDRCGAQLPLHGGVPPGVGIACVGSNEGCVKPPAKFRLTVATGVAYAAGNPGSSSAPSANGSVRQSNTGAGVIIKGVGCPHLRLVKD